MQVEYQPQGGREQVSANQAKEFKKVISMVQTLANDLKAISYRTRASKTTVEFGLELGVESGELTALLVKGTGNASFKLTLEWSRETQETLEGQISGE